MVEWWTDNANSHSPFRWIIYTIWVQGDRNGPASVFRLCIFNIFILLSHSEFSLSLFCASRLLELIRIHTDRHTAYKYRHVFILTYTHVELQICTRVISCQNTKMPRMCVGVCKCWADLLIFIYILFAPHSHPMLTQLTVLLLSFHFYNRMNA